MEGRIGRAQPWAQGAASCGSMACMAMSKQRRAKAFRKCVAAKLKPLTSKTTASLRRLIAHPYLEEFWQLDFEIHEMWMKSPIAVHFYCRGFDEVRPDEKRGARYPFKAANAVRGLRRLYPVTMEKKFAIGEDEYWFDAEALKEVIPWFHACWLRAGGKTFKFRARLAEHDTAVRFDLVKGRWTRDG